MSRPRFLRACALLLVFVMVSATAVVAGGRAAGTRPPAGGGRGGAGHGSASAPSRGGAPGHAQGHATYGHYGGHYGGYYPYYPYYGDWYWGPYWSFGLGWGWPYYGYYPYYGGYGSPYYYGAPYGEPVSAGPATVQTDVSPKKADVVLDGEPVGQARDFNGTWDYLPVKPGRHVLEFSAPGYMTMRVQFNARSGGFYPIGYALTKGEGIDPRSDTEPVAGEAAEPAAPSPPGAAPQAEPSVAKGFLRVKISPPDAVVYLDGTFLGRGDELARLHGALPVAAGEHRVEAVRPGFKNGSARVDVRVDTTAEIQLDLTRSE